MRQRAKAQGPGDAALPDRKDSLQVSRPEERDRERSQEREREKEREREQQRQRAQREQDREKEHRENEREQQLEKDQQSALATAKSAAASSPNIPLGSANIPVSPPLVKPLQTTKKLPQPGGITAIVDGDDSKAAAGGSVAAAAAALEKPKPKEIEKRISTMTEVQVMEKMRSVVDSADPKLLYSKIKKIGQG